MKIAALYDIHGNLPALNAVLAELDEVQPDLILVGGDIVSGPLPAQTLARLAQCGDKVQIQSIRGNGDREIVAAFDQQPPQRQYLPPMSDSVQQEARWVADQLTPAQRDLLAQLPEKLSFDIDGLGSVLFCHATPHNDEELFTPITPATRLQTIFSGVEQSIVVCGHTHMQFELHIDNLRILNAGSVGMPYADQPGAYWLLLSPQGYEFRRTAYDGTAAAQEIRTSGNPLAQEFAEENVLNVPTVREAMETFEQMAAAYH
jgi:predicted phosphodiesterase